MNKKLLWDSILQQAISGKLVPQLDTEPAVEQIGPDPAPDEGPFELPEKWKWVKLKSIGQIIGGGTPSSSIAEYWDNPTVNWITSADLRANKGIFISSGARGISQLGLQKSSAKLFPAGTVIYTTRGACIGDVAIAAQESCTNQGCKSFVPDTAYITSLWGYYALMHAAPFIRRLSSGTTFAEISGKRFSEIAIPLPSIEEQRRIVAKLDELKPLVDQFGEAHDKLSELEADFPRKLKASILQAAMQGKLVPQLDSEPAVEQIGTAPNDDKVPFDIPEKWKWVKAGQLGFWKAGGTPSRSNPAFWNEGTINWIKTGELNDGIINCVEEKISQEGFNNSSTHLNPVGAVLIAMYGATIGRLGVLAVPSTTNQACCACTVNKDLVDNWFLFFVLMGLRPLLIKQGAGSAQPNISKDKLVNQWVPLPPLAEQKRIVERIEQLFAEVDKMSACKAP